MAERPLYEILGCNAESTMAEIKAAHRRLAKQHHPDMHGGDDTQFKAVQAAYEVLGDPEKRAKYDATGETGGDDLEARKERDALKFAAELIEAAIINMDDVDTANVIGECLAQIENKISTIRAEIRKAEAADKRAEKAMKRMKKKTASEDDFLASTLRRARESIAKSVAGMNGALDVMARVKAIYDDYDYRVDKPNPEMEALRQRRMTPEQFDALFGNFFGGGRR